MRMPFTNIGAVRIEYECIEPAHPDSPTFVMLHEGLGSVSMWRDFPARLAHATGGRVVAYSRCGYGRSMPLQSPRAVEYMHQEALIVLPAFLDALKIEKPILFGHSDGASIALIHAGGNGRPVGALIVMAPHVLVEDVSIISIAAAKVAYLTTDLRARLARYHDDVDGAFWGWNDIWLSPAFRSWNIEQYLSRIRCGVLAIQGEDDEYGTMQQIERIAQGAPEVSLMRLEKCRHSPHRDQPEAVLTAVTAWTALHVNVHTRTAHSSG